MLCTWIYLFPSSLLACTRVMYEYSSLLIRNNNIIMMLLLFIAAANMPNYCLVAVVIANA